MYMCPPHTTPCAKGRLPFIRSQRYTVAGVDFNGVLPPVSSGHTSIHTHTHTLAVRRTLAPGSPTSLYAKERKGASALSSAFLLPKSRL